MFEKITEYWPLGVTLSVLGIVVWYLYEAMWGDEDQN